MLMEKTILMLMQMTMAMDEETTMEEEMTMAKTLIFFLSCILNFFSIYIIKFFFFGCPREGVAQAFGHAGFTPEPALKR